jgi:hypothetical protein
MPNGGPHRDDMDHLVDRYAESLRKHKTWLRVAKRMLRQVTSDYHAGDMSPETINAIEQFLRENHGSK